MSYPSYYDDRAAEQEALAAESPLENVRARHLRAAAAWRQMAEQARKIERMKAEGSSGHETP